MISRRGLAMTVALAANAAAGSALAQPNASFNLTNQTDRVIEEVYATSAGVTNWGRDRLGGNRILAGGSRAIRLPANGTCVYDIRVVYAGGRSEQRQAVNTCAVDSVAFGTTAAAPGQGARPAAPAQDGGANPSFNLINRGSQVVAALYAAPAGTSDWGANRLEDAGLAAGTRIAIRLPQDGTCDYKLRVVFRDGKTLSRQRVNLCQRSDIPVP